MQSGAEPPISNHKQLGRSKGPSCISMASGSTEVKGRVTPYILVTGVDGGEMVVVAPLHTPASQQTQGLRQDPGGGSHHLEIAVLHDKW